MEIFDEGPRNKKIKTIELAMPALPATDNRVAAGHRAQSARHGVRRGLAELAEGNAPADERGELKDFGRVHDAAAIVHHRMSNVYTKETKDK